MLSAGSKGKYSFIDYYVFQISDSVQNKTYFKDVNGLRIFLLQKFLKMFLVEQPSVLIFIFTFETLSYVFR